ncbi:MAG: RHS repeat protein [Chloroflexi bacterium]|nr:RHS repeat protein [Chloroflexota bacterium]
MKPLSFTFWRRQDVQSSVKARAVYRYDSYSNGVNRGNPKGRRTEMWDVSGRTRWTYDARGRILTEERWIDGQLYSTRWEYDAMDRLVTMTYPDGLPRRGGTSPDVLLASAVAFTNQSIWPRGSGGAA